MGRAGHKLLIHKAGLAGPHPNDVLRHHRLEAGDMGPFGDVLVRVELRDQQALPAFAELPAVIETFKPAVDDLTIRQTGRSMRAAVLEAGETTGSVEKQHKRLIIKREGGRAIPWQILQETDRIPTVPPDKGQVHAWLRF